MGKTKIVCIVGPTGVGKTAISIKLAKMFNGEIISADSMQIYKRMDVGTAKITDEEMQGVKHHLLDIVEPSENFSVAEWKDMAETAISDITQRGKTPFIVGGTCLYVNALINDFKFYNSERQQEIRSKYEKILKEEGVQKLYLMLQEKDPIFASGVDPKKERAIIRYLEILESGDVDLKVKDEGNEKFEVLLIGLYLPRERLYENINARVDKMIDMGLEGEIDSLVKNDGLNETMQSANAIGYREFWALLDGSQSRNRTIELIKQHSRNYAKRQFTFMRKMKGLEWYEPNELSKITTRVYDFLRNEKASTN